MKNYTVDYFIEKFEKIPEELWTTHEFESTDGGKCASGHCGMKVGLNMNNFGEIRALHLLIKQITITARYASIMSGLGWETIVPINDGNTNEYQQPTPKQRILAALYDIKKLQQPKQERIIEIPAKKMEFIASEKIAYELLQN